MVTKIFDPKLAILALSALLALTLTTHCQAQPLYPWREGETQGESLKTRYPEPEGFARVPLAKGSFGAFLRHLPMKAPSARLRRYDGKLVSFAPYADGIIDIDVGEKDLQQCADTLIRLYAEFQYGNDEAQSLSFKFTSGDAFPYQAYLAGKRPVVSGRKVVWQKVAVSAPSRNTFRQWLDVIFTYAGTASLARDLPRVPIADAQVGDLFISPGFPGHTVMIADMAVNKASGDVDILLIEGFTPAQDAHVLSNLLAPWQGVWFHLEVGHDLVTPVWRFGPKELHRIA